MYVGMAHRRDSGSMPSAGAQSGVQDRSGEYNDTPLHSHKDEAVKGQPMSQQGCGVVDSFVSRRASSLTKVPSAALIRAKARTVSESAGGWVSVAITNAGAFVHLGLHLACYLDVARQSVELR